MVRPDLGHVKNVPSVRLSFLRIHDLDIKSPGRVVPLLYSVVQVVHVVIGIPASQSDGFLCGKVLDACVWFVVPLDVFEGAILRHQAN